jgi:hypothetical protein
MHAEAGNEFESSRTMTELAAVLDFGSLVFGLWLLVGLLAWLYALPGRINTWVRDPDRESLWSGTKEFGFLCAITVCAICDAYA